MNCNKEEDEDENIEIIKNKVAEAGYALEAGEVKMLSRMKTAELGGTKSRAAARVDASPVIGHGIPKKELTVGFISQKWSFPPDQGEMKLVVEKSGEDMDYIKNTR